MCQKLLSWKINPTMALLAFALAGFGLNLGFAVAWPTAPVLVASGIIATVLGIVAFTPLHDASHGSASSDRTSNEAVMYLCWPLFLHSPFLFRAIHFQHHAHTGDARRDPDAICKRRTLFGQWIGAFLIVFHYYFVFLRDHRGWRHVLHATLSASVPLAVAITAFLSPWTEAILAAWILPNVVAIGILGYLNTAWPHANLPAGHPLRATRNLYVPRLLQVLMCNQNLHLVHHLKPQIPWYRYPEYWRENERRLTARGAVAVCHTSRSARY